MRMLRLLGALALVALLTGCSMQKGWTVEETDYLQNTRFGSIALSGNLLFLTIGSGGSSLAEDFDVRQTLDDIYKDADKLARAVAPSRRLVPYRDLLDAVVVACKHPEITTAAKAEQREIMTKCELAIRDLEAEVARLEGAIGPLFPAEEAP